MLGFEGLNTQVIIKKIVGKKTWAENAKYEDDKKKISGSCFTTAKEVHAAHSP